MLPKDHTDTHVATVTCIINRTVAVQEARSSLEFIYHGCMVSTLQSLTGKYRGLQGNPCNENRVPCNESRFFPVRIDLQGVYCTNIYTVLPRGDLRLSGRITLRHVM